MYFHNNNIKRKFSTNLLFTDADSLVYEIKKEYVYKDFYWDKSLFEFSDWPRDSEFFDPVNKKVIGKMKDELKGKIISEFVALKSKKYSWIEVDDGEILKKAGVNKSVINNVRHK